MVAVVVVVCGGCGGRTLDDHCGCFGAVDAMGRGWRDFEGFDDGGGTPVAGTVAGTGGVHGGAGAVSARAACAGVSDNAGGDDGSFFDLGAHFYHAHGGR